MGAAGAASCWIAPKAARCVAVSAPPSNEESPAEAGPATLGDLLYAKLGPPRMTERDWVELVRKIAVADQRALHVLYGRTHRLVFTYILRIVKSRETAEELTVDVYHEVWRRAARYVPSEGGSVVGWIMNQARSRALDRLRFEGRKKRSNTHAYEVQADNVVAVHSEEILDAQQTARLLRQALVALTADERRTIETAFFSEYTYLETAERLNQPLGSVKTRVRSGLAKLRRALTGWESS
jgi:RNA polymerase sigma-70 factor, ECF subfamily